MKFALASYGTRGDIEPTIALGRELVRRGHEVHMAVSPDLVDFVESSGLAAVAYGPDTREWVDKYRDFFKSVLRKPQDLIELLAPKAEHWEQMSSVLMSMADGADLLYTGLNFEQPAANVAEYYKIPLATLHYYPMRPNGQMVPMLPPPVGRSAMRVFDWLFWRLHKKLDDAQRAELGLRKATGPSPRRITELGSLEIQAYDEVCFPGLSSEWAKSDGRRPFVGTLTIEFSTDADDDVASWIAAGKPPIYFGFGSVPFESFATMVEMISAACAELGERALIRAGGSDFSDVPDVDHVKVVDAVSYATTFPTCRAVVHHGGSGTTAAGLRAGVPTLILWTMGDQPIWGAQIKRLKVGTARRFSTATRENLVSDLRKILAPDYVSRAREISLRMTEPAMSVTKAADLLEGAARRETCR